MSNVKKGPCTGGLTSVLAAHEQGNQYMCDLRIRDRFAVTILLIPEGVDNIVFDLRDRQRGLKWSHGTDIVSSSVFTAFPDDIDIEFGNLLVGHITCSVIG